MVLRTREVRWWWWSLLPSAKARSCLRVCASALASSSMFRLKRYTSVVFTCTQFTPVPIQYPYLQNHCAHISFTNNQLASHAQHLTSDFTLDALQSAFACHDIVLSTMAGGDIH